MERFRNILLLVVFVAAIISGVYLIGRINNNNSIDSSSANVYNIMGLSQNQDEILFPDKVVIDVNAQILDTQKITQGTIVLSYDKNILAVEDIVMPSNIIALNQKIDSAEGTVTVDFSTTNSNGLSGVENLAKVIFIKLTLPGRFTSVSLEPLSTLGNPNTLDSLEKSVSISF